MIVPSLHGPRYTRRRVIDVCLNQASTAAALAVGVAWLFFIGHSGAELSQDSLNYIKHASFMHDNGSYNTIPPTWPPLFPWVVSLLMGVWPWPAVAASWACGLLALVALVVFARFLHRLLGHPLLEVAFLFAFAAMPAVWIVYRFVWSESLFSLALLAHFFCVFRFYETGRRRFLLMAATAAAAAALTKYLGYSVWLPFFVVAVYHAYRADTVRDRLIYLAAVPVAAGPSLLWVIRNDMVDGSFHGLRAATSRTVMDNLHDLVATIDQDFSTLLLLAILAAVIFSLERWYRTRRRREPCDAAATGRWRLQAHLLSFLLIYLGLLFASACRFNINNIGHRFLVPIYPLVFITIAVATNEARRLPKQPWTRGLATFALALFVLVLGFDTLKPTVRFLKTLSHVRRPMNTYLSFGFDQTKTAAEIRDYLTRRLLAVDRLLVSALFNRRTQRHHLSYGLFIRNKLFDTARLGELRLHNEPPPVGAGRAPYLAHRAELDLHFEKDGREKTVLFRNHAFAKQLRPILISLRRMMTAERMDSMIFVVIKPVREPEAIRFNASDVKRLLPNDMVLKETKRIGNFTFFRFAVRSIPSRAISSRRDAR